MNKEWKPEWQVKDKDMNRMREAMLEINEMGDPPIPLKTRILENRFVKWFVSGIKEWLGLWKDLTFLMMWIYLGLTVIGFHMAGWLDFALRCS